MFCRQNVIAVGLVLLVGVRMSLTVLGGEDGQSMRSPQFPPKTERLIYKESDVRIARENIERYPQAKAIADGIVRNATRWLDRPDEGLLDLIPTASVPRAFNVGTEGCPNCGKAIYEKGGTYPWKLDVSHPFQVECPICAERFPDNDFAAYYKSDFQNQRFLEGAYADDGWGWVGPDDQRYWFVAYANHWNWQNAVLPAIRDLARAYLLTGDKRFAHKAAVMLYRIAQVYPAMDYHEQSRYGQLQAARGARYEGKTLNHIWETGVLHKLAEAYDAVWDTIDGDQALQQLAGMTGAEVCAHIEANLLEEGIEAVFEKKISGNYGMHQRALIYAALARGAGPVDKWLDGVSNRIDSDIRHLGTDYALYNLVYRDGVPYETSPGYNFSWVRNLTEIAETLARADRDVYANPKARLLYDGVMDLVNIGTHTPALGDSGNVYGGCVGRDPFTFQSAYRAYKDNRLLNFLGQFSAAGEAGFSSYETLFQPIIAAPPAPLQPQKSRLLDGYGMGILNNPSDTVSLSLYYGTRGGHGHFDRLHFDIFANGLPMTPDLGYPDFMNAYVPGIYTWSKNTISHNTVTVNASRQQGNNAGTVRLFADGPFARVLDVNASDTYSDCTNYNRRMVMIDVDEHRSYFVDLFEVTGGSQHDYSLHGPPGDFRVLGGEWTEPAPGTLAGEDVAVGQIYDNESMKVEGFAGSYGDYRGSGFQHLSRVQRRVDGDWCAEWRHAKDPNARLRIRIPNQHNQEILLADAQVSPVKQKQLIKYVLARRTGDDLNARFVSVLEPYSDEPFIEAVRIVSPEDGFLQVVIERSDGWTDLVSLYTPVRSHAADTTSDMPVVRVATTDDQHKLTRFFEAGRNPTESGSAAALGRVVDVHPLKREIRIRLAQHATPKVASTLNGRVVHFRNSTRQTAHPIVEARREGNDLVLRTRDALLVGRARLTSISDTTLTTAARFQFPSVYRGAYVSDERLTSFYQVRSAQTDAVKLAETLPSDHPFVVGKDAWIVNVGVQDELIVPLVRWWERD